MGELSHIGPDGAARMVDVGGKQPTERKATAQAVVRMKPETAKLIAEGGPKGDVLQVARLAGIQGAKRTAELIPLCHTLPLDSVSVDLDLDQDAGTVTITTGASTTGRTGVEMEALTAASVAALTIYDMVKAAERGVTIESIALLGKSGGRSGDWSRDGNPA
jgi:cyclic pyranopterin phosphate synthase